MEDWSGSSIDGSLDDDVEFDSSNIVVTEVVEIENEHVEEKIEYHTQTRSSTIPAATVEKDGIHKTPTHSNGDDYAAILIPSCKKLNDMLHKAGYTPIDLTSSDIDANVSAVSFGLGRSEASQDALQKELDQAREKLEGALRREKLAVQRKESAERECDSLAKQMSEANLEAKRKIKSLELLIQEGERKSRQREAEMERMREKLQAISSRERDASAKQSKAVTMHRRGEVLPASPGSVSSAGRRGRSGALDTSQISTSSTYTSTSTTRVINKSATVISSDEKHSRQKSTRGGGGADAVVSMEDVVNALEGERDDLLAHTDDLERQLSTLTKQLKKYQDNRDREYPEGRDGFFGRDSEDESSIPVHTGVFPGIEESMPAHVFNKMQDQSTRIQQLVHQLEMEKQASQERKEDVTVMRARAADMRQEIENLRIELDARPSMPDWTAKVKEVAELESKLHNVVMMRDEAAELTAWRSHLSTRDRIKADKRNHELKLWLLESLPKTVMKEVLQNICRELDISEVSEILLCIKKLKAVVKAVPRMEKFITSTCNFVFQRESPRHAEGDIILKPTMEDVLPVLQRWWTCSQDVVVLTDFEEKVVRVLKRIDTHGSSHAFALLSGTDAAEGESDVSDGDAFVERRHRLQGHEGIRNGVFAADGFPGSRVRFDEALLKIRSLVEFQEEIFRYSQNFSDAQKFINERPEVLVNSLIAHIRYLFGIRNLQGVIPRMNEVYLFTEEMRNFMTNVRDMLHMKNMPDATVLTEIYGRIKLAQADDDKSRGRGNIKHDYRVQSKKR